MGATPKTAHIPVAANPAATVPPNGGTTSQLRALRAAPLQFARPGVSDPLATITVSLRLRFPSDVLMRMEEDAQHAGLPFDDYLISHIRRTLDFTGQKPLYVNDEQRRHLERFLGANFDHAHELVEAVKRTHTMHVDGCDVTLSSRLIERLKSRAKITHETWDCFLQRLTIEELERWVGMR